MKKLTLLLCALTLVFACNKNDEKLEPDHSNNEVSFTDGGIKYTRVTDSQFDSGDEVRVRALVGNSVIDQATYTYANGGFTSTSPITILEGQQFAYQAIYPGSFSATHEIAVDQSEAESYEMSDLLVAKVEKTNDTRPSLTFNHVMSSIVLNIYVLDEGQVVSEPSVDVTFNLQTTVDFEVHSGRYLGIGDVNSIIPYSGIDVTGASSHNYSVIAAPQTVLANKAIADVVINGTEHFQLVRPTDLELLSGKQYIYTFRVDVTTRESSVEFDGEIDNWGEVDNDGSEELKAVCTFADFEQGKYPTSTDNWIITDETATLDDFYWLKKMMKSLDASHYIKLDFPNLTTLTEYAFGDFLCDAQWGITANNVTTVEANAIMRCEPKHIILPKATSFGEWSLTILGSDRYITIAEDARVEFTEKNMFCYHEGEIHLTTHPSNVDGLKFIYADGTLSDEFKSVNGGSEPAIMPTAFEVIGADESGFFYAPHGKEVEVQYNVTPANADISLLEFEEAVGGQNVSLRVADGRIYITDNRMSENRGQFHWSVNAGSTQLADIGLACNTRLGFADYYDDGLFYRFVNSGTSRYTWNDTEDRYMRAYWADSWDDAGLHFQADLYMYFADCIIPNFEYSVTSSDPAIIAERHADGITTVLKRVGSTQNESVDITYRYNDATFVQSIIIGE